MLRRISVITNRCIRITCTVANKSSKNYVFQCESSKALCSVSGKDLPTAQQYIPADKIYAHDTDILLVELRKAKSVDRLLQLIKMHVDVMNDKHIVECFSSVHNLCWSESENLEMKLTIINDEAFQTLCTRAMNRVRFLEPADLLTLFKTLSALRVKTNTYIMQAVLKVLSSQINNLSLRELIFFNFLLAKQNRNAQVEGLKMAIPLVLQVQIDQQLDSDNVNEVVNCLKLGCKAKLKPATVEKMISALLKRSTAFTAENCVSIIFSLFYLDTPVDGYKQLMNTAFSNVSANITLLPQKNVLDMLHLCQRFKYYYPTFFLSIAERAVAEQWKLNECYHTIISFHKLNFFSSDMLNLLCKQMHTESETLRTNLKYSPLTLAEFFTFANYQLPNVQDLLNILCSISDKVAAMEVNLPHLFVKFITNLAMLGCLHEELLMKILNENYLFNTWSYSKRHGRILDFEHHICYLQWALELYDKDHRFSIPAPVFHKIMQTMQQKYLQSADYPLKKFLENGLGGPQFFKTAVFTKNGHVFDHVLAMRNDIYPVALNYSDENKEDSSPIFIEDLQLPEDTKIVTVIVGSKDHYCEDPCILKGWVALKIKNLIKMSYYPVVINYHNWMKLADREKIPYLMREIKQAIQSESAIKTDISHV